MVIAVPVQASNQQLAVRIVSASSAHNLDMTVGVAK